MQNSKGLKFCDFPRAEHTWCVLSPSSKGSELSLHFLGNKSHIETGLTGINLGVVGPDRPELHAKFRLFCALWKPGATRSLVRVELSPWKNNKLEGLITDLHRFEKPQNFLSAKNTLYILKSPLLYSSRRHTQTRTIKAVFFLFLFPVEVQTRHFLSVPSLMKTSSRV